MVFDANHDKDLFEVGFVNSNNYGYLRIKPLSRAIL